MPWIAPEQPDLVWFSGADVLRFLNDIISQELGDMSPGETRRSFLLEPQGKLQFLLWVIRTEDRIGLVTDPGRGDDLAGALNRYRIRVDVDVTPEEEDRWVVVGDCDGYDISWPGVERHLVIGSKPDLEEGSVEDYERLRIQAGEPRWGVDVDEGTIPHASGLVPASVDFTKGCFLGQELVARIDSRGGNTPKNLLLIETEGGVNPGDQVVADGKEVGEVTSAADGTGLAMIKRSVSPGDSVEVNGTAAVVRELPAKTG
ncbi:MAG: YgfZ/GcvT domain-containing protein [Actinomycetota bacterium]